MAFVYRPRSADTWEKRANQSSGDFESFVRDNYKLYKPKKGDNAIRILPPTFDDADHFGITVFIHYGVGPKRASVLCLQAMNRGRCVLCEARAVAIREGDEDAARELRTTKRTLTWVLNMTDEDMGPLLWAMPIQVDSTICKISKNQRTKEIYPVDDPDSGFDIYFDVKGEGITTKYEGFMLDRDASSVKQKWIDYVVAHPLPETLIWRTYDVVKQLYEGTAPEEGRDNPPTKDTPPARDLPTSPPRGNPPTRGNGDAAAAKPSEEPDEEETKETYQRRARPAPRPENGTNGGSRPASRREEINDEVPWTRDEPEDKPPAVVQSVAQRLKERHGRSTT